MAEPKKRLTSARSGKRRSHINIKLKKLSNCPHCHQKIIPHHICLNCGYYKNKDVLNLEEKIRAKEERRKTSKEELNKETK